MRMFNGDNPPGDPFVDEEAREEIRLKLEQSLSELNAQIMKLRSKYEEMTAKSKEYFEQVVEALISGDEGRASIYAEEIAEIKRLASILVKTQLVLEQVKLRLETILEISELMGLVVPLLSLITEVGDEIAGVAPDAAKNLHELATYIEDFSNVSSVNELKVGAPEELDEEARKILEEAQKAAAASGKLSAKGRALAASTMGQVTPAAMARARKAALMTPRSGSPKETLLAPRVWFTPSSRATSLTASRVTRAAL